MTTRAAMSLLRKGLSLVGWDERLEKYLKETDRSQAWLLWRDDCEARVGFVEQAEQLADLRPVALDS